MFCSLVFAPLAHPSVTLRVPPPLSGEAYCPLDARFVATDDSGRVLSRDKPIPRKYARSAKIKSSSQNCGNIAVAAGEFEDNVLK